MMPLEDWRSSLPPTDKAYRGRDVAAGPDEQVVDSVELGAGVERRLRHGDTLDGAASPDLFGDNAGEIGDAEGQRDAVPALGIGVQPDDMLAVEIFERVGDEPILSERRQDHPARR